MNPPKTLQTEYGKAFLNKSGYYILFHGYGQNHPATLHRIIFAKHIKRRIPEGWEVHHIDGNRLNNNVENLVALHKDDHRLLHM